MKKTLQLLVALLVTATATTINAQAVGESFDDGNFTYEITSTDVGGGEPDECKITGWVTLPTAPVDVVVPGTATYTGFFPIDYTVTAVGNGAFSCNPAANRGSGFVENQNITSVTLPASVTAFDGAHFFRENPNLTSINLENIEDLGSNAFVNCDGLTGIIDLPACKNIGAYAFFDCNNITGLNAPIVESCGAGSFYNMDGVKEFNIPATLQNVDNLFLGFNDALVQVQLNWDATQLAAVSHTNDSKFFRGEWLPNGIEGDDFVDSTKLIYVPVGSKSAYVAHPSWGKFPAANIIEGTMPTLSVNKLDAKALGFSLYPNPTRGIVSIKNNQERNAEVSIYDINGRVLFSKDISNSMSEINISDLANGIYLFKVKSDSNEFVKRIVKQ
ncbi:putative secreted protein (Por secretion system target) [Jejuia pallidilutea]|uniref:Putative secreted protein (Por secretion system target) n=1 Tax=Jejuia pallidilutea TaxID=504487 RepID=A0A362X0W2_9FLAO|nr:leucine-rich repeat domain-containing protein [Jejuia pallidilutea]PQV49015.1 putative secreted protein (Por secretion system target) [Jejuia pallidilutea]